MFDADRPITNSRQDRLGRTLFSKYLARCLLDHKDSESLTVGLFGGWGTGKTSLFNLILEELHHASDNMFDDEKPIILNFSPWSYSGQNQLIYSFFRRLSSEIRRAPFLENSEKIIQLLELYVSFFTHKPVPKSLRIKQPLLNRIIHPMSKSENYGWGSGRDLTQVKAELNELLRHQKHKIIIFIDNISRVNNHEINQIFQIVKSMGDYANTIYMLAMDKKIVTEAIDQLHDGNGTAYLEKVVQLAFEIPPIAKQDLEGILFDRLKPILTILPEGTWNSEHWADVYYPSLRYFFNSARDITHYMNALGFGLPRVKDIVNPVDFIATAAIFVFAPQIFYGIRENKDLFTDLLDNVYELNREKRAEDKVRCDEILNRPSAIPKHLMERLLLVLFPRLRTIYQPNMPFYHSESLARINHRVCTAEMFDVYFRLSISTGHISETEANALLSITHDEEGFALALLRLNQDERVIKFLDLLDGSASQKIQKQNIPNVINALIDSADLFPEGKQDRLSLDTQMRVHRILHQLLRQFDTSEERFAIFDKAIKKSINSLYSFIHELHVQSKEHAGKDDLFIPAEHRDFTPAQLDALKKSAVEKIQYWAKIGRLGEHPKLISILYAWLEWGNPQECRNFVAMMVLEDKGLIAFLCDALNEPIKQAMSKLEKTSEWSRAFNQIENFIAISFITPHAKMIFEDATFEKLREQEQLAILIFLDLAKVDTVKLIPKTSV